MTLKQMFEQGRQRLMEAEVPEADANAWYLLQDCFSDKDFSFRRSDFFLRQEETAAKEIQNRFFGTIEKRCRRVPLEYIIGYTEFMGLVFEVNENVLVPRQDTEILVETALPFCEGRRVLDLCTGSGCIGLSIAMLAGPDEVVLSDISEQAIRVTEKNLRRFQEEAGSLLRTNKGVQLLCGDLFGPVEGTFDIIVSNPPYIATDVITGLMPEVRDFEPTLALDGGADGMDIYRRLTEESSEYLNPDGMLIVEIGYDQGERVSRCMEQAGYSEIKVIRDFAANDRVVTGKR